MLYSITRHCLNVGNVFSATMQPFILEAKQTSYLALFCVYTDDPLLKSWLSNTKTRLMETKWCNIYLLVEIHIPSLFSLKSDLISLM